MNRVKQSNSLPTGAAIGVKILDEYLEAGFERLLQLMESQYPSLPPDVQQFAAMQLAVLAARKQANDNIMDAILTAADICTRERDA